MVFLPSELWLQILSQTSTSQNRHLWRSLRQTNRQLRDCVEQHFKDYIIPTTKLVLTFGLPCYDARNPLKGKGIFRFSHFESLKPDQSATLNPSDGGKQYGTGKTERIICNLVDVEPEHYMDQFLIRWDRLRESSYGYLPESLEWTMELASDGNGDGELKEVGATVRLKRPVAFSGRGQDGGCGKIGLEWRASLTSLYSNETASTERLPPVFSSDLKSLEDLDITMSKAAGVPTWEPYDLKFEHSPTEKNRAIHHKMPE